MSVIRFSSREKVRGLLCKAFAPAAQREGGLICKVMKIVDFESITQPNGVIELDHKSFWDTLDLKIPYNSGIIMRAIWDGQMITNGQEISENWYDDIRRY